MSGLIAGEAPRAFPLPTVSEDTLHYALHIEPQSSSADSPADAEADAAALATLISTYVKSLLTQPWLWNKDAWELKVESAATLSGTMRVGDAVDDEWLVVWLLREVSRKWPQLVISIRDSDGEFLLIEAAHELPAWVAPENAENRLWLSGGHLHLIPLSVRSSSSSLPKQLADDQYDDGSGRAFDPDAWVSEADALAAVRTGKYRADAGVENAVWERISCYPVALKTHQHHTKAYLPEPVARALRSSPDLIQRAIEGFYVRDPAQLRAAARMTHFPPSPSVLAPVLMTRAGYAQLQGQVFHPPRVFGPEWHVADGAENDDERRWRDLGVKIATGFEIMYREGGRKGRAADVETGMDGLRSDPAYQKYVADLGKAGFFGDEVQDSAEWKKREAEAAKGWIKARSSDTTQQRQSFAYVVDTAIQQSADVPAADLVAPKDSPEDDDKWLHVDPADVDAMLKRAAGARSAPAAGMNPELGDEHAKALQDLAAKVQEFVGGQGDLDGARFADELSDDDMPSDSEDEQEPTEEQRKERLAKLVPGLAPEEWGRKVQPAAQSDIDMASESEPSFKRGKGVVAGTEYGDSLLPPKMRPPIFAKQEFDGVVSDSSDEEDDLPAPGSLGRKIAEMKWSDGAPTSREARIEEIGNDEEGDDEDKADRARAKELKFDDDELDELMRQRVWGDGDGDEDDEDAADNDDMDIDMGDEQDDFLKFTREALGISDDMWDKIISSRRERGAYVPEPKTKGAAKAGPKVKSTTSAATMEVDEPKVSGKNMSLDSFETMMAAMEAELHRAREDKGGSSSAALPPAPKVQFKKPASAGKDKDASKKGKKSKKPKSKFSSLATLPSEADLDNMDDDDLAAMDAELRAALEEAGDMDDDLPEVGDLDEDLQRQYRMMRDLLESASQGQGGAASALLSRLGETMGNK